MSESKSTVVLSIPAPKCRFLLDTGIFRALCGRYRVLVSGYLSERPDIIATYGGPDVEFIRQASPSGGFGGALTRMTESARELGFQFQHRKHPWVGMAWRATSRYRSLEPPIRRGVGRRLVVNALAVAARKRASWRRYTRWASRWIVDSGLEDLLARERPAAVVMTGQGQGSPQELVLGLAAERLGLRTIWLPVTPDDPMYNGHLVPDHDAVCAWGPVMRRQLEEFHGIPPTRVIDLGNVMTRLQEDLMAAAGPGVALRERIGIPAGRPIVTYFSVVNSSATETVPAVERVFSIFEPHTELIKRGRRCKPIEFGHKVLLCQSEEKIITDYDVMEKMIADCYLTETVIDRHEELFGEAPEVLAGDKGFCPKAEKYDELEERVDTLAIPKRLRDMADEVMKEWQMFRAGIEGTISGLGTAHY